MGENGWILQIYDGFQYDDGMRYKATFQSDYYECEVIAVVSYTKRSFELCGSFGVMWLEIVNYNVHKPTLDSYHGYSLLDIEDMQNGIILAEKSLLKDGIPFVPDYDFHGRNKANMKRRNDALRRKLNVDKMEKYIKEYLNLNASNYGDNDNRIENGRGE
jgi:hypothetical protein